MNIPEIHDPIELTKAWVERLVVGLNLCPFAHVPFSKGLIRFVVSSAETPMALLEDLQRELEELAQVDSTKVETTLLIHPHVLDTFEEYNNFLDVADAAIQAGRYEGVLQVASFHPLYQFADTELDDAENYSNRSPFPMLHILREDSITRVLDAGANSEAIVQRNQTLLNQMGSSQLEDLLAQIKGSARD